MRFVLGVLFLLRLGHCFLLACLSLVSQGTIRYSLDKLVSLPITVVIPRGREFNLTRLLLEAVVRVL